MHFDNGLAQRIEEPRGFIRSLLRPGRSVRLESSTGIGDGMFTCPD